MKDPLPVIAPDGPLDEAFASEPCVYRDASGALRMLYEGCDSAGVTRILSAVSTHLDALPAPG